MSNPLFSMMQQQTPMNGIMQKFQQFQQMFRGDPKQQVQQLLADHPGSDLYVLPEMWATGFATQPQDIAEDEEASVALLWMRQAAAAHDCDEKRCCHLRQAPPLYLWSRGPLHHRRRQVGGGYVSWSAILVADVL